MNIEGVIKTLEKQRQELTEIIGALRHIGKFGASEGSQATSLREFEKHLVSLALERSGGNQTHAALPPPTS